MPGGDKIGERSLDRTFEGLKALGASWKMNGSRVSMEAKELRGTTYRFAKNSHT